MSEEISGHATLDTYLVFDKAKVTNENSRLTNKQDVSQRDVRRHSQAY